MMESRFRDRTTMGEPARAVFLSYASQDEAAARRICETLREAGIEVWFDRSNLRGGEAWDASIRSQIKACTLFVPVISANTDSRSEGYFRLEWRLALERLQLMADDRAFLLPVVIDDTVEASARVPDPFRERQWSRLPGGEMPAAFVEHLTRMLSGSRAPASASPACASPPRHGRLLAGVTLSAVLIAGAVFVWNGQAQRAVPNAPAVVAGASALDRKSVAVLPFENLSGRAEDAYLADGLHEEILNALARLRDLKVISRTSVMAYRGKKHSVREIGERLGVGTVLEGSIRRDGNTLRLTVQVIDARDDHHLFAANYDRDLARVLDLQSAVARQVADALAATLTRHERGELDRVATNSGDAYNRYLRAVALFRQPAPNDEFGVLEPMRLLGEALRFDPDFADAHALLSRASTWAFFDRRRPEDGARAKQAMERALAIDPQLPEAQLARGLHAIYVAQDLDRAVADLGMVVQSRPSSAEAHSTLGYALRRKGRMEKALEHHVRAWDLDPLNRAYGETPITTLLGLRRFPDAIEQARLHSRRFPNDPDGYFARARIEMYLQHNAEPLRAALRDYNHLLDPVYLEAIKAEIARAEGRFLDAARLWEAMPTEDPLSRGERLGFLYLAAGDASRAEQSFAGAERHALGLLKSEPGHVDLRELAVVQSMLGKHAAAQATIEKARALSPEERDALNGPTVSFARAVVLVRSGRAKEGYAEVTRLLQVPFGAPVDFFQDPDPVRLLLKDDPRFDELLNRPPRL